jgi:hypothetical protein
MTNKFTFDFCRPKYFFVCKHDLVMLTAPDTYNILVQFTNKRKTKNAPI